MALQARAGIGRAGVMYSDLHRRDLQFTLNGVSRKATSLVEGFSVKLSLDGQPAVTTIRFRNAVQPETGHELKLSDGHSTNLWFGGTVMSVRGFVTTKPETLWECQVLDYTWLMDRFARVFWDSGGCGANTAVRYILDNFTNGGFHCGYIPQSLGNVDLEFRGDTVSGAIGRIAKAVNAVWKITSRKEVDIFQTLPATTNLLLTNASSNPPSRARNFSYERELSQVRTRVWYEGGGSPTTEMVAANSTTIPVAECGWYSSSGGTLRSGLSTSIAHTGKSAGSGPGNLTGATGVSHDIPQGEPVYVLVKSDDAAKQTALSTRLGGISGVALHYEANNSISLGDATGRAVAHLGFYGSEVPTLEYTIDHVHYDEVGRIITSSMTLPMTISGEFRVQSIEISPRGDLDDEDEFVFERRVTARLGRRQGVLDLLVQ